MKRARQRSKDYAGPGVKVIPATGSWEFIERQFVQGMLDSSGSVVYPTIQELAEMHGVSYNTLRRAIANGQWMHKRESWQQSLNQWTHPVNTEAYVQAATKFDATCISAAQKAMDNILMYLGDVVQTGQVSQLDLDRLGRAAVSWQRVGRLALGMSTENNSTQSREEHVHVNEDIPDIGILSAAELELLQSFIRDIPSRNSGNTVIESDNTNSNNDSTK